MTPHTPSRAQTLRVTLAVSLAIAAAGCESVDMNPRSASTGEPARSGGPTPMAAVAQPARDGEVPVPDGYREWTRFVPTVDKPDAGQVREIYINDAGLQARRGEPFPHGTVLVMEIYPARKDGEALTRDADGRLVKGPLDKIFVMAKGRGWGARQPAGTLDNGDWLYGAYQGSDRAQATADFGACRSCHSPMSKEDFVARYGEHFDTRGF